MLAYFWLLHDAVAATIVTVIGLLNRADHLRFPAQAPVRKLDDRLPSWLTDLESLGFQTFETADTSVASAAPQGSYTVCVSTPRPDSFCRACGSQSIRMLGETGMTVKKTGRRIFWLGWACGCCGNAELSHRNAIRFLSMLLAENRNMMDVVLLARRQSGKPLYEMITAMLAQNEDALQDRVRRSAILRAILPEEKNAKVLPFRPRAKTRSRNRF